MTLAKRVVSSVTDRVLAGIGGIKVVLEDGSWFTVRPSGEEPKRKIYIKSF
jgi:phosphomannomutase